MKDFEKDISGAVAVITGGASGMGNAFARRFGAAGCRLVLADIEKPALERATAELREADIDAIAIPTDVSDESSMDALAAETIERFGRVDLLFNNAGVGGGGTIDTLTTADWQWVLGVNLWGVIHGLRVFLPHMMQRDTGYIVNTASVAGHTSYAQMAPYSASKHAVVAISETLFAELHQAGSSIHVSVLCPGIVNTNIIDSDRNRPEQLRDPLVTLEDPDSETFRSVARDFYSQSLEPAAVAEMVMAALGDRQFYIWTDDLFHGAIARRHTDIQQSRNPTNMGNVLSPEEPVN